MPDWPKLGHSKVSSLIETDFDFLYRGKINFLFDSWNSFKDKILIYFKRHIHNEDRKRQLLDVERANVDAQDYLTLILLNAVLPPTSRILNQNGKGTKNRQWRMLNFRWYYGFQA
ncbi:uncharacterized protein [Drosophila suzukii]|uniref:Uncharacterized protein n=1 Tax=Drosophila suzukii TaxID=28584 RepID=A0AB39ZKG3_DROSZ|nr:uncharacterized protein LOC108015664 [Drosophila suzukii]